VGQPAGARRLSEKKGAIRDSFYALSKNNNPVAAVYNSRKTSPAFEKKEKSPGKKGKKPAKKKVSSSSGGAS